MKNAKKKLFIGKKFPKQGKTEYYILNSGVGEESARITLEPELPFGYDNWRTGERINIDIIQPLVYKIDEYGEGVLRAFYGEIANPLMVDALVNALRECGVNNLDLYTAVIAETRTGKQYKNYKAVNIIGLVQCVDMGKSIHSSLGLTGDTSDDVLFFKKLVLDEGKARASKLLMFRIAENPSVILVHKNVKEHLEKMKFERLEFYHPLQYRG